MHHLIHNAILTLAAAAVTPDAGINAAVECGIHLTPTDVPAGQENTLTAAQMEAAWTQAKDCAKERIWGPLPLNGQAATEAAAWENSLRPRIDNLSRPAQDANGDPIPDAPKESVLAITAVSPLPGETRTFIWVGSIWDAMPDVQTDVPAMTCVLCEVLVHEQAHAPVGEMGGENMPGGGACAHLESFFCGAQEICSWILEHILIHPGSGGEPYLNHAQVPKYNALQDYIRYLVTKLETPGARAAVAACLVSGANPCLPSYTTSSPPEVSWGCHPFGL